MSTSSGKQAFLRGKLASSDAPIVASNAPLQESVLLQDPVAVVGYPIGGDTISVTSGVVSRIEVCFHHHS